MIKKFDNFINEDMENETWKKAFTSQVDSGKYWKNLFKDEFETHQFLDRSDAVYICKKAQADAYQNVIKSLDPVKDKMIIDSINEMITKLWDEDDSALGYTFPKDKTISKKDRDKAMKRLKDLGIIKEKW